MFERFTDDVENKNYFQQGQKVLVAVSGGVDSMVLLHFMEQLAATEKISIGIAHINHQLREEAEFEAAYLRQYCQQKKLPFFCRDWLDDNKAQNMEAKARKFRYDFFAEIMEGEGYSLLLTAHHRDDQAETILMKLTRGSSLTNLVGIREEQPFKNGKLIRPFLIFSKEELERYAQQTKLVFFEDATNQTDSYMRNRIRRQVIPVLKKENAQFLQHVEHFGAQVGLAKDLIESVMEPKFALWVKPQEQGWSLELSELRQERASVQFFFMNTFLQRTIIKKGITIKQVQVEQLLSGINHSKPQLKIELESGWVFMKEYDRGYLVKKTDSAKQINFCLNVSEHLFLSKKEWIGLEVSTEPLVLPDLIQHWQEINLPITAETPLPLVVRHRENGDKIALHLGLRKKLNRVFIDKKVPNTVRNKAWVILSAKEEIIWVPNFANSYLSIPEETDKIHYRLLYRVRE